VPDDIDNPRHEAQRAYTAAASGVCERYQHDFAFEFNQRLQTAIREGVEPDEAGYPVMAEMSDVRRDFQDGLSDALLAAEADFN